jgi:protoporphyrinogen oxidase
MSLAHYAARAGLKVLVMEKAKEPGGCLASVPISGETGSQGWLELGAHTGYNSYLNFLELIDDLGFLNRITSRQGLAFRMLVDGRLCSIASRVNVWELLRFAPRLLHERRNNHTVESFYSDVLGRENLRQVVLPMLNAVASQDTRDFPADALLKSRRKRRRDVRRSFAFRGGFQSVVLAVADRPGIECAIESDVESLCQGDGYYLLRTTRGRVFRARWAAIAAPANVAARLLIEDFPGLAKLVGRIEVRPIQSVGIILRNQLTAIPRVAGIMMADGLEGPCFSAVSADAFFVRGKRSFTFHFKGDSYDGEAALQYACRVLGVSPTEVESVHVREQCMPAIRSDHANLVRQIDEQTSAARLLLLGNYFSGLSIEDCVSRARREYERMAAAS